MKMHKNNVQQPDDIDCNAVNESNNEYLTPSTIDHNKDNINDLPQCAK